MTPSLTKIFNPHVTAAVTLGALVLFSTSSKAKADTATSEPDTPAYKADWRWVKGTVFVPTTAVNEAQEWDQYDPGVNDRELHYASVYGINCVRVYLHYLVYEKNKNALLKNIEDFLTHADKYGIKTEFVFFDDCWNQPDPNLTSPDYHYPPPLHGVHNSRWLVSPGQEIRVHYADNRDSLKAYVQDIVNAHAADPRIAFWETYNEPNHSKETQQLLKDSIAWIHETGTKIPVTATGKEFAGGPYSDFISWHEYGNYKYIGTPEELCTECMNREGQDVPGIVEHFKDHTGFIMWEFGIGRDNCRFAWHDNRQNPREDETPKPFHGIVYPDGHPWSVDDVKALLGPDAFAKAPLFAVNYYKDTNFTALAKSSVTPMIDFDLGTEPGTGSPDASAGMPLENFSIRWTGSIVAPKSDRYTLSADGNGQANIYMNSKLLFKKSSSDNKEVSKKIKLTANKPTEVKIEYINTTGSPALHITWSGPGLTKQPLTPTGNASIH